MNVEQSNSRSKLWPGLALANAFGLAIGLALWGTIQDTLGEHGPGGSMLASLVGLLLVGAVAGILQWRILREHFNSLRWGILGGSVGFFVGFIIGFELAGPPLDFVLGFVGFGVGIGFGQWFTMRKKIVRAWRWIIISGLSFGVGGLGGILIVGLSGAADAVDFALGGGATGFAGVLAIIGIIAGAVGGALTGLALIRLLGQPSQREIRASAPQQIVEPYRD
jgi:MFS family permease